jgi:hypothetical protein
MDTIKLKDLINSSNPNPIHKFIGKATLTACDYRDYKICSFWYPTDKITDGTPCSVNTFASLNPPFIIFQSGMPAISPAFWKFVNNFSNKTVQYLLNSFSGSERLVCKFFQFELNRKLRLSQGSSLFFT